MPKLSDIRLFLLDMDGTFYLGDHLLPGSLAFLAWCEAQGVPYCFLTNNSSRSADAYLRRLAGLGVEVNERQMLTSGDATLLYLQQRGIGPGILLVGTPSLEHQFTAAGFDTEAADPAAVVLGYDTTLTYKKLVRLCDAVRAGLPYIATHPDLNCPVPGGFEPDIGAVIAFVEAATGRRPDAVVGKPNGIIAEMAAARFGVPVEQVCMVGDRLYTDIALGPAAGVTTALVLCGETTHALLEESDIRPDYTFENLLEMTRFLRSEDC